MRQLADKLWDIVLPALQCGYLKRSAACFHYRLAAGSEPAVFQAEGLLVALEAASLRDAFTAFCAAERWGSLVQTNDFELRALLRAATIAAGERIAMALPTRKPNDEQTAAFSLDGATAMLAPERRN